MDTLLEEDGVGSYIANSRGNFDLCVKKDVRNQMD